MSGHLRSPGCTVASTYLGDGLPVLLPGDDGSLVVADGGQWVKKNAPSARTAIGLGTAATHNVGTGDDDIPTNSLLNQGSFRKTIDQTAHGFFVGSVVRLDAGTGLYVGAIATSLANADVIGMVGETPSVDQFILVNAGEIEGMVGLTTGTTYYLSATTAGAFTDTAPTTPGQVSKPILRATSSTTGIFTNQRAELLATLSVGASTYRNMGA
jgi:hypothetical protein